MVIVHNTVQIGIRYACVVDVGRRRVVLTNAMKKIGVLLWESDSIGV